jgi:hypothetical protein
MLDPGGRHAAMSRQINLYSPAFRHQAKQFSAVWTLAAVIAIAAGMSAYYAWDTQQLRGLSARRSAVEAQLKQLREQLVALGQAGQRTKNKALEDQVARAENLLKTRQDLFERLQSGEIGNRDGYAKFLTALARQRVEGVWLTGIEISGPGNDFALEGRAIRAELLAQFIKLLRNEEALRGKPIGTLALHEREIDPKGELKAQAGPGGAAPVQGGQTAQGSPTGQPVPGLRVVEFRIGTGVAAAAGSAGR